MYRYSAIAVDLPMDSQSGVDSADSVKMVVGWKVPIDRTLAGSMIALMATVQLVFYLFALAYPPGSPFVIVMVPT
jgi:hypothetical protein